MRDFDALTILLLVGRLLGDKLVIHGIPIEKQTL